MVDFKIAQEASSANGSEDCIGNRTETCQCYTNPCPVNCVFGNWSEYSIRIVSYGGRLQYRKRKCDSPPLEYAGKGCDGPIRENRSCGETKCPCSFKIV